MPVSKFSMVGFFGNKFISMVKSSPEGINAILTAYKRGINTIIAVTMLINILIPV